MISFCKKLTLPYLAIAIFAIIGSFALLIPTHQTYSQALLPLDNRQPAGNDFLNGSNPAQPQAQTQPRNLFFAPNPETGLIEGNNLPGGGTVDTSTGETVEQNSGSQGATAADKTPPKQPEIKGCGLFNLDGCVAWAVNLLMWVVSFFLYLSGYIFDLSMQFTLNISDLMTRVPVVDIGWKIFRDLSNIFFIFILLWISISTILGLNSGETKELVTHLVIVALLINFSLFITKTVIDGSNIIAMHFYNLIVVPSEGSTASFSGAFMQGLKIQTIYDGSAIGEAGGEKRGIVMSALKRAWDVGSATVVGAATAGPVAGVVAGGAALFGGNAINWGKIILIGIFGSALMLIAAYVFLVGAVLMLFRAIALMFVMMLSPLAFLAYALPGGEKYAESWKEALIKQVIFAPAFMALSFVVVKTIQSDAFKGVVSVSVGNPSLASAFTTGSGGGIAMVVNFLLVIGLMLGCILIAKKLEVHGLEFAQNVGSAGARWVASGRFISTAGTIANYGLRGASNVLRIPTQGVGGAIKGTGQLLNKIPGLNKLSGIKQFGEKTAVMGDKLISKAPEKLTSGIKQFGKGIEEKSERWQKYADVAELDKKLGKSGFGATELGSFIREQTTGRAVHAKFGGEKSLHESYEESEKLRSRRYAIERKEDAEKGLHAMEVADAALEDGSKPDIKKFTDKNGNIDIAGFLAAMEKFMRKFAPKRENYATDADFIDAQNFHNSLVTDTPKRSDYAAGQPGEQAFLNAIASYSNAYFEKPGETFTDHTGVSNRLTGSDLTVARGMTDAREKEKAAQESARKKAQGEMSRNLNLITPEDFADMDEHLIAKMAKFANLKQLKAVMASKDWTVPEKQEMLGERWKEEVEAFKEYQKEVDEYDKKMAELRKAIVDGKLAVGPDGNVAAHQITIGADGKRYARSSSGQMWEAPKEKPSLPKEPDLKGWARNKMTKEEYQLAASIMPKMFEIPELVHTMRWGLTNKDFRTDENFASETRDGMTFLKDSALDIVASKSNPNYIQENTLAERSAAFQAAKLAVDSARAAGNNDVKQLNEIFRKTYAENTARDSIRTGVAVDWADGRAPNEIAGARSRNRNSKAVHRLIDAGIAQNFKDKDSEDVRLLLEDVLGDYQAEKDGNGIVSKQNRDLIRYLFTDKNSKALVRPIERLPAKLQAIYRELEAAGDYDPANAKNIKYRSDIV